MPIALSCISFFLTETSISLTVGDAIISFTSKERKEVLLYVGIVNISFCCVKHKGA
jgi:hypothetical protein